MAPEACLARRAHSRWIHTVSIRHINLGRRTNLQCQLSPASGSCWCPAAAGRLGVRNHPALEKLQRQRLIQQIWRLQSADRTSEGPARTLAGLKVLLSESSGFVTQTVGQFPEFPTPGCQWSRAVPVLMRPCRPDTFVSRPHVRRSTGASGLFIWSIPSTTAHKAWGQKVQSRDAWRKWRKEGTSQGTAKSEVEFT